MFLGIVWGVKSSARHLGTTSTSMSTGSPRVLRNTRLLLTSVLQHLADDPALLALQVSRRLPLRLRVGTGRVLLNMGRRIPGGVAVAALGASMSGNLSTAQAILSGSPRRRSRLYDEVALLVDREDLLNPESSVSTRARASWKRGELTEAVKLLEASDRRDSSLAKRLCSEIQLLEGGHRLRAAPPQQPSPASAATSPLRVLHLITNSLPHTQSGYSLRTHNILKGLRAHGIESLALTRTGYPVMVGKPWCADEDVVDGIRYRRTLPNALGTTPEERLEQEVEDALRLVEEFCPHVLHATTDYRNALVAQAISTATGIPWVFEVRGLMEMTWAASRPDAVSQRDARRSEKTQRIVAAESSLAREAGAVVTLSRTMADVLVDRGVDAARITLIPNGVDAALLEERMTPAEARTRFADALPAEALAIGAVSALVDYEGHDVLLRSVAALLANPGTPLELREKLRVVLVGDGVSAPRLGELARQLGISDLLVMPGRVSRQDAKLWVQALDVVVVPRKDLMVTQMVTPQKPAEALALGRPVIASELPALRETLENADGTPVGILVAPEDHQALAAAIWRLLTDSAAREKLAACGRDTAAARTWEALMGRYEDVYRTLLKAPREKVHGG